MLVHKGGKIKNWGGECRDVTPTKLQCQNIQRALQVFYKKNKIIIIIILNAKNLAPPFLSIFSGSKSMTTKINVL